MKHFWLYICLILIITFCLYFNNNNNNNYENFTPFMRKMYRPHLRRARLMTDNIYEGYKNNVIILLRKYNIL
jgi:hypothetical protein